MKTKPFRILALGDVVGEKGCAFARARLPLLRKACGADLVIANGENSAKGNGITPISAESLFAAGVDVITTGNHVFQRKEIYDTLDGAESLLRPANFPGECPGKGYTIQLFSGLRVLVVNMQGVSFMEPLASPFDCMEKILQTEVGKYDLAICDFHAEATSEKLSFAHVFDGRVQVIFGTHTHVPTADLQILPQGTGYITDLGMTAPRDSILGIHKENAIFRLRMHMSPPRRQEPEGACRFNGALFTFDPVEGRVISVQQILE